jgi:hypothetical protein
MAESVPVDNEMLHVLPRPVLQHLVDNSPESSPPTTSTPAVHTMPSPEEGAMGAVQ